MSANNTILLAGHEIRVGTVIRQAPYGYIGVVTRIDSDAYNISLHTKACDPPENGQIVDLDVALTAARWRRLMAGSD